MNSTNPQRIFDFLYYQREHFPQEVAVASKKDGSWVAFSTEELIEVIGRLSQGMRSLGLKKGDKIALVSYQNRPEWLITDLAAQQIGVILVPLYPTISSREYAYILSEAEVKYVFVGKDDLYEKIQTARSEIPSIQEVFSYDKRPDCTYWKDLLNQEPDEKWTAIRDGIGENDLATIIYTSGTTGYPKGVMLSHKNIVSNIKAVKPIIPILPGDRVLSFLPLCHIFERALSFAAMYTGGNIYFTGIDELGGEKGDIQQVKPHFFTTVPRLLEKVYEKIYNKGLQLSWVKRVLFFWALRQTRDYEYDRKLSLWKSLQFNIADKLIFRKWREALGGHLKGIITGAAPCPPAMARVFSAAGIPVREGYGLTEASPGISINRFEKGACKIGTVGPLLDGVEVRIENIPGVYGDDEGEVLCCGPNVMQGYFKKPEESAKVLRERDGKTWLSTGDVGKIVTNERGVAFLTITDRKKELLKTSNGKYVAPAPIESRLRSEFLIDHAMVVGENRKFVSALILPNEEALQQWCNHKEIPWTEFREMLTHDRVLDKYQRLIHSINKDFSQTEKIKKFILLADEWAPFKEDGSAAELTPTMKLKRRIIRENYANEIEGMYEDTQGVN